MIVDLLAMIRATGAAQLIQHVDEIKKDLDATEKALELTEPSLGVPLKVLEQQRALQKVWLLHSILCNQTPEDVARRLQQWRRRL